ncbi:MAG: thioesterase family protein [Ignavibacteria bacterium]|jgi:predicted thioesterase|nr:thioesterase family protein [Ignavibacteria bacterium]
MNELLTTGLLGEKHEIVTPQNTAAALGSGGLPVYATPAMVALMEGACVAALDGALSAGFSTVGTALNIKHIAATPLGMSVRAIGKLVEVDGKRLIFEVEAFDDMRKIGEGTHERYVIENERFMGKLQKVNT